MSGGSGLYGLGGEWNTSSFETELFWDESLDSSVTGDSTARNEHDIVTLL